MKYTWSLVVFILLGNSQRYRFVDATCVLSSDFGFTLNCAFKKSGLFRVRNLGGVKAHVGLGFTVGDELGFAESLSNVEAYKRRSASARIPPANPSQKDNRIIVRNPPARRASSQVVVPAAISASGLATGVLGSVAAVDPLSMQVVTPLPTVPPFKPIPNDLPQPTYIQKIAYTQNLTRLNQIDNSIPDFQSLPSSISKIYAANAPTVDDKSFVKPAVMAVVVPASTMLTQNHIQTQRYGQISPNNLSQRVMTAQPNNLSAVEASILLRQQQLKQKILAQATSTTTTTTSTTMKPLASLPSSPVRQTAPVKKYHLTGSSKVMNAPKEYYPVGYDKNFDDNFASRVELPETSFYCGDQKHFPGLYADEDLGCMVFHVCALTDDGLIMKSFLCPESTLFDQTILKCNWWFYVDCKNSKNLYDSNIPISKSYQLMKALTFFSSFKKEAEKSSKISDKDTR